MKIIVNVIIRYNDLILLFKSNSNDEYISLKSELLDFETLEKCIKRIIKNYTGWIIKNKNITKINTVENNSIKKYYYSVNLKHIPSHLITNNNEFNEYKWIHLHDLNCIKLSLDLLKLFNIKNYE